MPNGFNDSALWIYPHLNSQRIFTHLKLRKEHPLKSASITHGHSSLFGCPRCVNIQSPRSNILFGHKTFRLSDLTLFPHDASSVSFSEIAVLSHYRHLQLKIALTHLPLFPPRRAFIYIFRTFFPSEFLPLRGLSFLFYYPFYISPFFPDISGILP